MNFDVNLLKAQLVFRMLNQGGFHAPDLLLKCQLMRLAPRTMILDEFCTILDSLVEAGVLETTGLVNPTYCITELTENAAFEAIEARIKLMTR